MTHTCRVYINAHGVDVAVGATALEAVRVWDPRVADAMEQGASTLTDSRGLPADPRGVVHGGAIYRVVPVRK